MIIGAVISLLHIGKWKFEAFPSITIERERESFVVYGLLVGLSIRR